MAKAKKRRLKKEVDIANRHAVGRLGKDNLEAVHAHVMLTEVKTPVVRRKLMLLKIRIAMRAKKLTQAELSKKVGLSIGAQVNWYMGRSNPNFKTIQKLEEILDITLINYA